MEGDLTSQEVEVAEEAEVEVAEVEVQAQVEEGVGKEVPVAGMMEMILAWILDRHEVADQNLAEDEGAASMEVEEEEAGTTIKIVEAKRCQYPW